MATCGLAQGTIDLFNQFPESYVCGGSLVSSTNLYVCNHKC